MITRSELLDVVYRFYPRGAPPYMSVIARLEGARATKIEGRQLEAGHERRMRRVPHVARSRR
jgi:hypothetical protein